MHRSSSTAGSFQKKTPQWKLIGVVGAVMIFILLISYYQLRRTLDAIRTHNEDVQQQFENKKELHSPGDAPDGKINADDDELHSAHKLDLDVSAVGNNNNKENLMIMSEVKQITGKLVESLEKFNIETSSKNDLFVTTASKPISELLTKSDDSDNDDAIISKLDVELFVIWHDAIGKTHKILDDMRRKFFVVGIDYVDWNHDRVSRDQFESNLWRLYSGKGGWERFGMAKKVNQCGYGPFIIVAVVDPNPSYQVEHTAHGADTVNHNMNSAKKLYRGWSGGGFRVHGTFGPVEAEHDIALLFHRSKYDFGHVFKHLLQLQRGSGGAGDATQQTKFVLLVDEFVKNVRTIMTNEGKVAKSFNPKEVVPFNFKFDRRPLSLNNNNREISERFSKTSSCRKNEHDKNNNHNKSSASSLIIDDGSMMIPDPARSTSYRDFVFKNEFVTARQTLGVSGFFACRDLLLVLKTFIDAKQIEDITGFSQDQQRMVGLNELECLSCSKWPNDLKITLSAADDGKKGGGGEAARWAISSLLATSAEKNIYADDEQGKSKRKAAPHGFKNVPFFVLGSEKKQKKISFTIVS